MDKAHWMERLVDYYGFSFKEANDILQKENSEYIINCIIAAYSRGKKDGEPSYNYSGGY